MKENYLVQLDAKQFNWFEHMRFEFRLWTEKAESKDFINVGRME